MNKYLVLSGMGPDKPGIAKEISEAAFRAGCGIEDSRMALLGGEFAILILISGEERAVKALSDGLRELESRTGLTLSVRPTTSQPAVRVEKGVPYRISVVGMDRTGIVYRVTSLLIRHGINIDALETAARNAPVTGTPMFHMDLTAEVPAAVPVRRLREELAGLCDELNLDFSLEARD
jgi:glycine cleavage system transcriptional repressor